MSDTGNRDSPARQKNKKKKQHWVAEKNEMHVWFVMLLK